jgi:6-phosphogluconolactonase
MEIKYFGNLEIRIFNTIEELSKQAAEIFAAECKKAQNTKEIFTVLLCGGSTPQRLFELLAAEFKNNIHWPAVHIFFGDEREKKENPESNFQTASKIWLEKIIKEIPNFENNIHRIKMDLGLAEGAKEYEKEINEFAPKGFDLSLNGAGSDGHRNGIFPENPKITWKNGIWDLQESVRVYGYKVPPEINPHAERITLTPWFLNKSKVNILMLSGLEKADLLREITIGKENYNKRDLPAITFNDVQTIVLVDKSAASKI